MCIRDRLHGESHPSRGSHATAPIACDGSRQEPLQRSDVRLDGSIIDVYKRQGYGSVKKMSGKRRRPYAVRKTVGWHVNPETGKSVQEQITIGYAATRAEGLQMLAEYNNNPFDIKASKATFQEVYERWSKEKFPTISKSNVKGYEASYRVCGTLYNLSLIHI